MNNENSCSNPTSSTSEGNSALCMLLDGLVWSQGELDRGLKDVENTMNSLSRQIERNSATLRKIAEQREAIAILERNL